MAGRSGRPGRRAAKACLAVAVGVCAIPVSGWLIQMADGIRDAGAMVREVAGLAEQDSPDRDAAAADSLSVSGYGLEAADENAVAIFQEEVLSLEGLEDVLVNEACSVIGYTVRGSPEESISLLAGQVQEKGWTKVESGSDAAVSFVKRTGTLTWLLASCTVVGEETSVVLYVGKR